MIPTYRAKSKEQKNTYVEGLLIGVDKELNLCTIRTKDDYIGGEICYLDTLSINFPNMVDTQGNKIFASLQEDGKGGDILLEESRLMCALKIDESVFREFTAIHTINGNRFTNEKILSDIGSYRDKHFKGYDIMIYDFFMMKKRNIKIIGIQQ